MAVQPSPTDTAMDPLNAYDFIIIGGGTSGLVVANRLTENSHVTVLVLEAGTDQSYNLNVLVPGACSTLSDNPDVDWEFLTEPQVSPLPRANSPAGLTDSSRNTPMDVGFLCREAKR